MFPTKANYDNQFCIILVLNILCEKRLKTNDLHWDRILTILWPLGLFLGLKWSRMSEPVGHQPEWNLRLTSKVLQQYFNCAVTKKWPHGGQTWCGLFEIVEFTLTVCRNAVLIRTNYSDIWWQGTRQFDHMFEKY